MSNQKKLLFVRYINGRCQQDIFCSYRQAIQYVYMNFGAADSVAKMGVNLKKRIHRKISDSIKTKDFYCGGQWIMLGENTNE